MKKFFILFFLIFGGLCFAQSALDEGFEDSIEWAFPEEEPEQEPEEELIIEEKADIALGFGISALGFEIDFERIKNHFDFQTSFSAMVFSSLSFASEVTYIPALFVSKTDFGTRWNVGFPRHFIGFGGTVGIGSSTDFVDSLDFYALLALYFKSGYLLPNGLEFSAKVYLPFVVSQIGVYGDFWVYSVIQPYGLPVCFLGGLAGLTVEIKYHFR